MCPIYGMHARVAGSQLSSLDALHSIGPPSWEVVRYKVSQSAKQAANLSLTVVVTLRKFYVVTLQLSPP